VDLCELIVLPYELDCADVVWRSVRLEIPEELRCQLSACGNRLTASRIDVIRWFEDTSMGGLKS
jgi:hypothetical protein